MSIPTPEDRLATVESHTYTIQALGEALGAMSRYAHLVDQAELGFMIGFIADRLRQEADAVLAAAATRNGGKAP